MGSFDKLVKYAEGRGYEVFLSSENYIDPLRKEISISKTARPELQLFLLLHELGHVEQFRDSQYEERFHYGNVNRDIKTINNRAWYQILMSEVDAWERGKEIAKKNSIAIDLSKYDAYAGRCVKTYTK